MFYFSFKNPKSSTAFSLVEISVVILVIGILIAGVSQGIDLYQDTKLATARSLTTNSRVGRIDGLVLWLETTSLSSFDSIESKVNSKITNWLDINPFSDKKINFVQSTQDSKPTLKISSKSDLPILYFDGNDFFSSVNNVSSNDLTKLGDLTIFFVTEIFNNTT